MAYQLTAQKELTSPIVKFPFTHLEVLHQSVHYLTTKATSITGGIRPRAKTQLQQSPTLARLGKHPES
jgi:hypothetical protein